MADDRRGADGLSSRFGRLAAPIAAAILDEIDPDTIVAEIDIEALLARVDPDELITRVDVNALLDRVEVNELLDRVDVDRLLDRVDVERLLERVDIEGIVRRAGIPDLVAESTGHVAGSVLDLVRQQAVGLDVVTMRAVLNLVGRDPEELPAGPEGLVGDATGTVEAPDPDQRRSRADYEVTGHYAGLLSRLAAYAGDLGAVFASWTAVSAGLAYLATSVFGLQTGGQGGGGATGPLWIAGLVVWGFFYFWVSTSVVGRTPAMTALGLRVVARDGSPLRARRALVRVLMLPLSTGLFGVGFLGVVLDRERRALHDAAAGSAVVYDWGGRAARLPTPLGRWISQHGPDGS